MYYSGYHNPADKLFLSNGICFSVSDLSPPLSLILPTLHACRLGGSIYDCQFDSKSGDRVPIPDNIINNVVAALTRLKLNIQFVATEATREAINSSKFIQAILSATGLHLQLLRKEDEGRIGALGVASGFSDIEGLMMDLGGGSTQITWIISQYGNVGTSPHGSFSFPYGAAALSRIMLDLKRGKFKHEADLALEKLHQEMIPATLQERAKREGAYIIYLSGGGFRGCGYLLLYLDQQDEHHYPISQINGYAVSKERFASTEALEEVARKALSIFRVSDRRREQVPAVAFLVKALTEAIPYGIRGACFCQGGVREGVLFRELLPRVRPKIHSSFPAAISNHVITAFANTLYVHTTMEKESASAAALYSTSVGILSSTRGISHSDRARLAFGCKGTISRIVP
ncbi:Ppx/GppA phosphatase family-domain-containing protein [Aspergillus spinulosporus]